MPKGTAEQGMEAGGRAGLVARGAMYCVASFLALRLARGGEEQVDKEGALEALARQRIGSVLLLVLSAGFAGYAVWRFAKAITGAREGGSSRDGAEGAFKRLADVGRGVIYLVLLATTVRVIAGGRDAVGTRNDEQEWTATLLSKSFGRPLVGLIGVAIVILGLSLVSRGVREKFNDKLDLRSMSGWERRVLPPFGIVGHVARGMVFATTGWFVANAALRFNAKEAVGVDGALRRLAAQAYGTWILVAVAIGLLCFGLFSLVEARYRKVLDD